MRFDSDLTYVVALLLCPVHTSETLVCFSLVCGLQHAPVWDLKESEALGEEPSQGH